MDKGKNFSFEHILVKMDDDTEASCSGWFPTRVLDLAPPGSIESDGTTVKIISRGQVVPDNRYVTLSHRWNRHIPKLTSWNPEDPPREIPVEALTKTFRDFITVSRLLGFRYAWIDSPCIIQKSDHGGSDWSQECLTMDLVYRNSFCNLSAAWPTNSGGFFLDRNVRQFDLPIERFLSPRVLHFCRNEVIFECCQASKSERFRQSIPAIDEVAFEPFKNFDENFVGTYDTAACHRMWNRVPGIYNRCKLTYPDDKLVAVSGIARYLKTFLVDDVYVMGVWASDINAQMLWVCGENTIRAHTVDCQNLGELEPLSEPAVQTVSTPLRQCKGPNFSWVSTYKPVSFPIPFPEPTSTWNPVCECTRLVKYREGQVPFDDEPITEDILDYPGQPMVELKVAGLLRRVRLIDTGETYLSAVFLNENDGRPGRDKPWWSRTYITVFLDFAVDPSEIPNIESRACFCILWADAGHMSRFGDLLISIVLELVDPEMGRFRRIGIMHHSWPIPGPVVNFPGWNYDPETQLHTIYII
ncbi:hypothetical protein NCS56_00505400 [Fusarium sp. Ph1]|nr:hypothetical protein NCS56_00505400 [Fusarium sp. Ph1]